MRFSICVLMNVEEKETEVWLAVALKVVILSSSKDDFGLISS